MTNEPVELGNVPTLLKPVKLGKQFQGAIELPNGDIIQVSAEKVAHVEKALSVLQNSFTTAG